MTPQEELAHLEAVNAVFRDKRDKLDVAIRMNLERMKALREQTRVEPTLEEANLAAQAVLDADSAQAISAEISAITAITAVGAVDVVTVGAVDSVAG